MKTKIPLRTIFYQWEALLYREDLKRLSSFDRQFGTVVTKRAPDGTANQVKFSLYVNDNAVDVFLIGEFNNWGACKKEELENYMFSKRGESGFQELTTNKVRHKDSYLLLTIKNGHEEILRDPAAFAFDDSGNCRFWDYGDPSCYTKKHVGPNTLHRATKILQTDLPGLVAKWFEFDESQPTIAKSEDDLFTYIHSCGVLEKVKELGFNTIQFLPVSQSIDGDNWKYRYLSPYPFAVQKNWGDPDSFAQLIDKCHELGIAVVTDLILSHSPYKDYSLFGMHGKDVGIHKWQSKHNEDTFLQDDTPWGTKRFRYGDMNVRRYLVESALHYLVAYGIDGFRIDNVDGILRYGDAGDGQEREFGRVFMRELIAAIYQTNPFALVHLESHYFYGDNAKMLVAPQSIDPRALGATAYNSSRLTYYFHKEMMPKAAENISVWRFEQIREEKEWGRSNSTIADFHNHDAAAGLMPERATGSYAYDALVLKNPHLHFHAVGKIKAMEAVISFGCEGRTLDLLQSFLLQEGTFEHDSSIHWRLLKNNPASQQVVSYKQQVNELLERPAFWPENTLYRKYVNVDERNKVLVMKREDKTQGTNEEYHILINLSTKTTYGYAIGVDLKTEYEVVFDSDSLKFAGTGNAQVKKKYTSTTSHRFEHFSWEILLEQVAPYHVIVFKRIK